MKNFIVPARLFSAAFLFTACLAQPVAAQNQGSITRVYPAPDGVWFSVDGTFYTHAVGFAWPAGSKHTLYVSPLQTDGIGTTQYVFKNWATGSTNLPPNPLVITADPAITEYHAIFDISYALFVRYYPCPSGQSACASPGTVYVNGVPTQGDSTTFFTAGATVSLQATPNGAYIFTGWQPGLNQVIQGFMDTVTMNGPVGAYPGFQVARGIQFATSPPGLQVLADRTPVVTPSTLEWGWNTTHTVGPVSPQQDVQGLSWVFSSWSDGGAPTHSYTVGEMTTPDSLTAAYVRGERISLLTSPTGLKIKMDGRDWPNYNFTWGVGETHHFEAPAQQTDSQGHSWSFVGWSNGGPAVQDFVVPADSVDFGVRLTASYQPLGRLTITSSVSGLAVQVDGAPCATPCEIERPTGAQVSVSAPATWPLAGGSRADFAGFQDGSPQDQTVTLGTNTIALAANYRVMNQLTALADPAEGARWQLQPASPDGFYDAQTTVQVVVAALPGYRFRQWSGDLSGASPAGAVAMSAPRMVRALLERVPYIAPAGVSNAAGGTPQPGIAPGSIASISGASLATSTVQGPPSPLSQTLAGVTVISGGRILPLFFVSPTQINFLLPGDFPAGRAALTVSATGQPDVTASFTVVRNAPGLLQQAADGQAFAVAAHADGSAVTAASPATSGELLTLYGTGFGPTDPPRPIGFAIPDQPSFPISDPASISIQDAVVQPQAAFAAPGQVGVDALQFRIADTTPWSGATVSLHVTVNGQDSNSVLLPVQ